MATVSGGQVTGITITSPGINYTTATVTLFGGGCSVAATLAPATLAANTSGSLTKQGANILTLTGANTYTGNTVISGGTLALSGSGSIASSANINVGGSAILDVSGVTGGFTLGGAQTLTGTGTVNGGVTVASGGTIYPGSSGVGTLTFSGALP